MSKFSHEQKAKEAEREVEMRKYIYRKNAPGGNLSPGEQRKIAIMEEIANEYRELAEKDHLL